MCHPFLVSLRVPFMADDKQEICLAKTEYREAYNTADLERLLSVLAAGFTDCREGEPSFYGAEAPPGPRAAHLNVCFSNTRWSCS
jgi:hypothetical protein